jgi:hypothetical protein
VPADLLPEPEYLFRRFVGDGRESMEAPDTAAAAGDEQDEVGGVGECSIHDILDGYHSEDNIDDDDGLDDDGKFAGKSR